MLRRALTTAAARTQQPAARAAAAPVASSVRRLSAPPQQPPPPPSPEELQKMAAVSEERVGRIREGTYLTGAWFCGFVGLWVGGFVVFVGCMYPVCVRVHTQY